MLVEHFRSEFQQIHDNLVEMLLLIPEERLYWQPFHYPSFLKVYSMGQLIIHIAQIQEYLFNGLSANFWDHPHEWTTREALPEMSRIRTYLDEVADMRNQVFAHLNDQDLNKKVYLPDRSAVLIGELLLRALTHMSHHRGQVYAYFHLISDRRLPPISPVSALFKRLI